MSFAAIVSAARVDDVVTALQNAKVPAASTAAAGKTKLSELTDAQVTAIITRSRTGSWTYSIL